MSAPQLPPGSVVAGKYSVGACLGFGGSSATYHAAGADGREVALKIFDPAIRQRADIMAALEQTYAATNALPQDVAVPLLDAGYDPATGAPFSVTERIPYPSLAQLVAQRPLTPEEVTSVLAAMARVLDQAHARQLCHHALKPTNIFVGFTQGFGVKITDFGAGLARAAVPTQEGYAGSAPWLAPEQVQGGAQVGPAADVFATALVTFFALTGRSYWHTCQGTPDLAGWQREIVSPRAPASARALQLGVTLNSAFDGPLGTALAIDPTQRYRSLGELANAIEAIVMSRGPESSATMAFPSMGLLGGGEYPPPPAPMGGYGQPPSPTGGYGQPPQPAQQQAPAQAQPAAPPAQPAPGQPSQNLGETVGGRPIEPGAMRKPASSSKLVPILVGVVALLLVGGGVAAWVVLGNKPSAGPEAAASASASASAPGSAVAAAPSGSDSAAPAAAPSGSDSAPAPEASGAPSAAPSAEPAATGQEVSLTCDPGCDELKIDDKVVDTSQPIVLEPGKHTVVASKADFKTVTETITVEKGKKLEKKLKLAPAKPAAAAGPGPGPSQGGGNKQPCGKFLKRCK